MIIITIKYQGGWKVPQVWYEIKVQDVKMEVNEVRGEIECDFSMMAMFYDTRLNGYCVNRACGGGKG